MLSSVELTQLQTFDMIYYNSYIYIHHLYEVHLQGVHFMGNWSNIFSFSTSWNVSRHNSGRDMVEEILGLGFNKIELNYRVTWEMAKEILPLVERGIISITSLHNVFPRTDNPDFSPDSVLLAHTDPVKRKEAVEITKNTVDMAALFGAGAVVLHTSEIPTPKEYDSILKELYLQGKRDRAEYESIRKEFMEYRRAVGHKYVELTCRSLEEICDHIGKKNYSIILGIENRARCHQIPDFNQAEYMLELLKHLPVYFWYDIGHAVMMDALGILNNPDGLKNIRHKIFGMHIHDTVGLTDHCCPYASGDEFDKYLEYIKDAKIKVLELGRHESRENIIKSVDLLYERLMASEKRRANENQQQ